MYTITLTYIYTLTHAHTHTHTREVARDTPDSDNDAMCAELKKDEGWKKSVNNTRPVSLISDNNEQKWVDITSGTVIKLYISIFWIS